MITLEAILFNFGIVGLVISIGIFIYKYGDEFVFGKSNYKITGVSG